jgi:hypothetical protein
MGVPRRGGARRGTCPPWNNVISTEIGKIPNDKLVSKNRSTVSITYVNARLKAIYENYH